MRMKGDLFMDSFDQTVQKAKEAFSVACKKTSDVVAIQKQKLELSSLQNKLNKAYAVLGRLEFNNIKNTDCGDPAKAAAVSEIKSLLCEIKELKNDIDKAEGKITCPKCGSKAPAKSRFCNACGADLSSQAAED